MTREEAIENLKWLLECSYVDSFEDAENEALRMAIKALEYDDAKYHEEHGEVIVDKAVWEDAKKALEQQSMPTMVYPQVEGITPVVVEPIPKLPPVNQQEPCDDAISRQAVLSKKIYTETEEGWSGYTVDADYIEHLPSVRPQEPKTGHWIRITNGAMREKYICSKCGRQIEDDGIEGLLVIKYPYCHCGAKMVETQESEEV